MITLVITFAVGSAVALVLLRLGHHAPRTEAETLVSISTASNGDLAAAVTFTSHQNPADSPDQQQSCTDWNISLFLVQSGGGYLVDQPPPGYHASYHACT